MRREANKPGARAFTAFAACFVLVACGGGGRADSSDTTARVPDSSRASVANATRTNSAPGSCAASTGRIEPTGVGPVQLGKRRSDLPADCAAHDTTFVLSEGMQETGVVVSVGGSKLLALTTGSPNGEFTRLYVRDAALRTVNDLGVGSSVADLRHATRRVCVSNGEGTVSAQLAEAPGYSFALSATPTPKVDAHSLPDTARIVGIWVVGGKGSCL
jgi:hypothetical protein